MAAVAVRKKVVNIGHFSPCFCLQSVKVFLFVRSNQKQLYLLTALKIREKWNWAKWARWAKIFKIIQPDNQLCTLSCFLVFACLNQNIILFILFQIREKEQAKWAKWARILKNTLRDEQLRSLTYFFYLLA